jgi:GAF domain-containing protein
VLPANALALAELLTRVAQHALRAVPGAAGVGLTLSDPDRADTVVNTAAFVAKVDAAQHGLGEGPCISAAREGVTFISGSLSDDPRWPRFGSRAARSGVHSALALPLVTPDEVVGALNVYAHAPHVFDERAAELGEIFAVPAAIAVQNARELANTRRLVDRLQTALDERMVIERAVGIVMSRTGVEEAEALARLVKRSQHEHTKLLQVASTLVDEAVRQARAQPHD